MVEQAVLVSLDQWPGKIKASEIEIVDRSHNALTYAHIHMTGLLGVCVCLFLLLIT